MRIKCVRNVLVKLCICLFLGTMSLTISLPSSAIKNEYEIILSVDGFSTAYAISIAECMTGYDTVAYASAQNNGAIRVKIKKNSDGKYVDIRTVIKNACCDVITSLKKTLPSVVTVT